MKDKLSHLFQRIREGALKDKLRQIAWIYQYARRYWKGMLIYTALGLMGTLLSLGSTFMSRDMVDIITGHRTGELVRTFVMMISLVLVNTVISQATGYFSTRISLKVDAEIKSDIFSKMLVTDMESISAYHTGDLLTRWSADASRIADGVLTFLPNLVISLSGLASAFIVMIVNDPTFAIFAVIGIPVNLLMSRRLVRRMENNNKQSAIMSAKMSGFNQETFSNIQTVKAFNMIDLYTQKLKKLQKEFIDMRLGFQRMSMATSFLMTLVGLIVSYSCYGWGIYRVWSGVISYGTMTQFLTLSGTLTGAINTMIGMVPEAISLTISAERLMDIVQMPQEDFSRSGECADFLAKYRANGISVDISGMEYTYQSGKQVFSGAAFEANPHEIIALVGPSGEGKTTMLRLILALLHPQGGEVTIRSGGEQLPISPSTRQAFSYVPQGNTMFSGTIAENLRNVKPDATDEEIVDVLQRSCAWDFVKDLPEQINAPLHERGGGLSEGQCQRLSIARALLAKAPILLLDEATSALDVATERRVLRNIMVDNYPRTVIVTTHRPTVLNLCHRVYAIRDMKCTVLNDEQIQQLMNDF